MSVFYQSKILQDSPKEMSYGGEVKPRKMFVGGMSGVGFNPTGLDFGNISDKIAQFKHLSRNLWEIYQITVRLLLIYKAE